MQEMDILLRFMPNETDEEKVLAKSYIALAKAVDKLDIDSREKTIAIERLEESYMWAKKGILYTFGEEEDSDEDIIYDIG
jgi:hypothetical protein